VGTAQRSKPKHLAAKLLQIRNALKVSQTEMVRFLDFQVSPARVSEYERGIREPNLIVLLSYARAVNVVVDVLIDDALQLPKLRLK
jgi:transcriptional regulator with XRE-family HTH domain